MTENRKVFLIVAGFVVLYLGWDQMSTRSARKSVEESQRQTAAELAEFRAFLNSPEGSEIKSRITRLHGEEAQKRWEQREFLEWRQERRSKAPHVSK